MHIWERTLFAIIPIPNIIWPKESWMFSVISAFSNHILLEGTPEIQVPKELSP